MASANNALRVFFILAVVSAVCTAKRTGAKTGDSAAAAASGGAAAPEGAAKAAAASGTFDISKLGATSDGKTDSTKVNVNKCQHHRYMVLQRFRYDVIHADDGD
jgi:galacturan 1,4-alpha-galacturonidase